MPEDRSMRVQTLLSTAAAGAIAVGLIVCAVVLSRSFVRVRTGDEIIRVIGSARKPIRSDLVMWRGRVARESTSVSKAYDQLEADMARVKAYLLKNGIRDSEIIPLPVSTKTLYAQTKNPAGEYYDGEGSGGTYRQAAGYQLSQEIEVRSQQVDLVDRIARQSTEMISTGIPFESHEPMYLYTKLSQLKVTMQAEAARDARARAEQIAASSGCRVGRLRFARMNVPQITPLYAAQESDGGYDDTSALDKRITAIVVAGYAIR